MQEHGVNGQLLRAIKSFYCPSEVCVRVNGKQSKPFRKGVGLRQGCVLSPLLFTVYMNWIDKCSQADECATIGNCKISRLLFADDLVLLSSTESGLQRALNSFADACNTAGIKTSTAKTQVHHLSRNPDQCMLQVNGGSNTEAGREVQVFFMTSLHVICSLPPQLKTLVTPVVSGYWLIGYTTRQDMKVTFCIPFRLG